MAEFLLNLLKSIYYIVHCVIYCMLYVCYKAFSIIYYVNCILYYIALCTIFYGLYFVHCITFYALYIVHCIMLYGLSVDGNLSSDLFSKLLRTRRTLKVHPHVHTYMTFKYTRLWNYFHTIITMRRV